MLEASSERCICVVVKHSPGGTSKSANINCCQKLSFPKLPKYQATQNDMVYCTQHPGQFMVPMCKTFTLQRVNLIPTRRSNLPKLKHWSQFGNTVSTINPTTVPWHETTASRGLQSASAPMGGDTMLRQSHARVSTIIASASFGGTSSPSAAQCATPSSIISASAGPRKRALSQLLETTEPDRPETSHGHRTQKTELCTVLLCAILFKAELQ